MWSVIEKFYCTRVFWSCMVDSDLKMPLPDASPTRAAKLFRRNKIAGVRNISLNSHFFQYLSNISPFSGRTTEERHLCRPSRSGLDTPISCTWIPTPVIECKSQFKVAWAVSLLTEGLLGSIAPSSWHSKTSDLVPAERLP